MAERLISAIASAGCWKRTVRRRALRELCAARTECSRSQLYERGVSLEAVENALVLAATRRMIRPAGAAPLGTIRSLAYFSPVIEEVLQMQVSTEYFHYLLHKLQRAALAQ